MTALTLTTMPVTLIAVLDTRAGATFAQRTLASTLAGTSAVYFLLHFPWARAPQALPGTLTR